jgi:molybdopterin/thiamine biosynthesis adenylyltransferase
MPSARLTTGAAAALDSLDGVGEMRRPDRAHTRATLVFAGDALDRLRATLLADAPLESAAFVLARPVRTPNGGWRLIAYDTLSLAPTEYGMRSSVRVDVPADVVARVMQRARAERAAIVVVHTHPFAGPVAPSVRDREGEGPLLEAFNRRVPDVPHARLILGFDATHAAMFDVDGTERHLAVTAVGPTLRFVVPPDAPRVGGAPHADRAQLAPSPEVYDRQARAFGADGQQRLATLRIGIVGLGGTGSVVAQQLAHLGVSEFVLVDPDRIELTNLNRVVGARGTDVGRRKVDVARDMIGAIHPAARVAAVHGDVCEAETARTLLDCDVFVACTDSQGSRAVLSQLAYQYVVPGIDVGVAIRVGADGITHVSGRVQMLAPALACLACSAVLNPETVRRDLLDETARAADPYVMSAPAPVAQPAVISINSTASSLAVTMLLSAVSGVPFAARYVRLRLETGRVVPVTVEAGPECPVCGPDGYFRRGDTWPRPGRVHAVTLQEAATDAAEVPGRTEISQ